ncbi:MAG TPA: MBL fold metallo-hydrolase [Cyclobacteriaceae bacterium]
MNRRKFVLTTLLLSGTLTSRLFSKSKSQMKIHFLRHATLILEVNGLRILVDPMLAAKGAMDPVKITRNTNRIPLTDLSITDDQLKKELETIDAVIVSHTHRDHWDDKARELLNKKISIICQPTDVDALKGQAFENLLPVDSSIEFKGLKIYRTDGQHGTGEIGLKMGNVSGFVIEYKKEKIYIAGDTIWCSEVEQALNTHKPNITVVNAGAAQFDQGDPITMTAEDVVKVCQTLPSTKVIVVHMETINHCDLTREQLQKILTTNKVQKQCLIPKDGEWVSL